MIKGIAHVAIATESIAVTAELYRSLGLEVGQIEVLEKQKVKVAVLDTGQSAIELVEPLSEDSPISRFLKTRGEGLHHISLIVEDLRSTLKKLKEQNFKLIDEEPRPGAEDSLIAFIHPHSTGGVLIELTQLNNSGSARS
jgi:methylmalonyl-CoA/ethylmalonyl-CoA epimerase